MVILSLVIKVKLTHHVAVRSHAPDILRDRRAVPDAALLACQERQPLPRVAYWVELFAFFRFDGLNHRHRLARSLAVVLGGDADAKR